MSFRPVNPIVLHFRKKKKKNEKRKVIRNVEVTLTDCVNLRLSVARSLYLPLVSFDLVHLEFQLLQYVLLDALLDLDAFLMQLLQ